MDTVRFDSLTRAMAIGKSRRDVLKLLAGGAAGGVLAVTVFDDASAECHAITCSSDANCCTGAPYCVSGTCQTQMAAPAPDPAPAPAAPAAETDTGTGGTTPAVTVPATGIGSDAAASGAWMGAAVAGGAALLASRMLRREKAEAEDTA